LIPVSPAHLLFNNMSYIVSYFEVWQQIRNVAKLKLLQTKLTFRIMSALNASWLTYWEPMTLSHISCSALGILSGLSALRISRRRKSDRLAHSPAKSKKVACQRLLPEQSKVRFGASPHLAWEPPQLCQRKPTWMMGMQPPVLGKAAPKMAY
jgi:hypothetical protein